MPYGVIVKTRQPFAEVGEGIQLISTRCAGLIALRKGRAKSRDIRPPVTVKGTQQLDSRAKKVRRGMMPASLLGLKENISQDH